MAHFETKANRFVVGLQAEYLRVDSKVLKGITDRIQLLFTKMGRIARGAGLEVRSGDSFGLDIFEKTISYSTKDR